MRDGAPFEIDWSDGYDSALRSLIKEARHHYPSWPPPLLVRQISKDLTEMLNGTFKDEARQTTPARVLGSEWMFSCKLTDEPRPPRPEGW